MTSLIALEYIGTQHGITSSLDMQAAAVHHLTEVSVLSKDAVLSRAWSYPLLGIAYLISHPKLYSAVAPVVLKAMLTSLGITGAMFFFTYLPQVAFCALFSGPLAFVPAAVMVLGESYALVTFVSKAFFLSAAQDRICMCGLIHVRPSHVLYS